MTRYRTISRAERLRKRRNTTRNVIFFSCLGVFFLITLFILIAFGHKKPDETDDEQQVANTEEQETLDEHEDENDFIETSDAREDDEEYEDYNMYEDIEVEEIIPTDDNVIVAYRGDWQPIGTAQTGEHVTNYNDGSQDRMEIKRAVSFVTNIAEDDMIEHWVGNDGHQKVQATVSSKSSGEFYRVYLTWVDEKGWQPTKVERLKEYNG